MYTCSTSKMKQISVVLLLSFVLDCCAQYRVEYVLIADACCEVPWNILHSVDVEYRRVGSTDAWQSLRNFANIDEKDDTQLCNKTAIRSKFASNTIDLYTRQGTFPHGYEVGNGEGIQLRFIQANHHGGYCDCWGLACDILLLNSSGHIVNSIIKQQISCNDSESSGSEAFADSSDSSNDTSVNISSVSIGNYSGGSSDSNLDGGISGHSGSLGACPSGFQIVTKCLPSLACGGSASVERGFITEFTQPDQPSCNLYSNDTFRVITEQREHNIQMNGECDEEDLYLEVEFTYKFRNLDSFDEGLELSFNDNIFGAERWIPLWFFSANESRINPNISLGDIKDERLLNLRGYAVNFTASENSHISIKLCGPGVFDDEVRAKGLFNWQFRWLQTVANDYMNSTDEDDVIYIYDVSITVVNDTQQILLFHDDFSEGEKLSTEKWFLQRNVKQQKNCSEGLNESCLEFSSIGKQPDCAGPITSREVSTVCLNSITQIQYTLITASSSGCPGSGSLSSKFQFPQLQYQWRNQSWANFDPEDLMISVSTNESNITRHEVMVDLKHLIPNQLAQCSFNHLRFRFIQREHRGGFCDCWAVANLTATLTNGEVRNLRKSCGSNINLADLFMFNNDEVTPWENGTVIAGFCQDSASVIRLFQTQSGSECANDTEEFCDINNKSPYRIDCNGLMDLKIEVAFDLTFGNESSDNCKNIEDFSEGVELSVKRNDGEWIPLMFIAPHFDNTSEPFVNLSRNVNSEQNTITLRGYTVPFIIQTENVREHNNISICRNDIFSDRLQFRWLQTSYQRSNSACDIVVLGNVTVRAGNCSNYVTLLPSNDSSLWDTALTYNAHPQPISNDGVLSFYQQPVNFLYDNSYTITSRQAITKVVKAIAPLPSKCQPPSSTTDPSITVHTMTSTQETTDISSTTATTQSPTATSLPDDGIVEYLFQMLKSLVVKNLTATTYNLSSILRDLENQTVKLEFSELVLSISSQLLDIAQNNFKAELVSPNNYVAGSTLLQLLENFALNNHDTSYPLVDSDNIILRVKEVSINSTNERISLIEGENARISIPREVIASVESRESVRVVSILYRNMSGLLPQRLEGVGMNDSDTDDDNIILRLASPVISMSPQCDSINCTTSDLSTPVEVTFTHTPYDMALLEDNSSFNATVTCVFWDFDDKQRESLLFPGKWSPEGCERNPKFSTSNFTVCHCDHLTHFAILLSARPLDLPPDKTLALQITGYIGVSVSLVAMAATILVFLFLKPLRTMRNYIHIQLCVTLGIAQIIFVAGVEPRLGEGSGVSIGCRSVAVLLHYWFLVSFMWMLMEGVVLYVALVRVFVKHYARYIAAFTITCYGLPLLYVGALMLPLGFVRTDIYRKNHSYDYGYEQACYLNPDTSFVWSLIAPVILILLANIGFFIMAIVIMYKHQKRPHTAKTTHKVKHWLKASISLTVVMGITWIIGFLVIKVEELFVLAYIFTIFVAFQGIFIFVIFVLLSKQVRENYAKWWKAKVAESDFLSKRFGDKTLGTSLTAQNKTPIPLYDKTDQKSSGTASKECLEQSQAIEIENSQSQHKLPTVPVNSCDNESHGSFATNIRITPLVGATPLTENGFSFNITYVPTFIPLDDTAPPSDKKWSTDTDDQEYEGSSGVMEEVELHTKRVTPNDHVVIKSFICDPITENDQSSKL